MKTGKRIVSKAEYAASVGKVTALSSLTIAFLLAGEIAALVALTFLGWLIDPTDLARYGKGWLQLWAACSGASSLLFLSLGAYTMKRARKIDIGIPLTRANTADLPAPESLVRASQEPVQEDQSILLRAAADATQTPAEQLLRPVPETITNGVK